MRNAFLLVVTLFLITITKKEEKEFNWDWFQNDFMVESGPIELGSYDKRYIRYINIRTFKFNRTCVAHNFTVNFKIDVGHDLEVTSQTYKRSSNEYRLFPVRMGVKVCKGVAANIMGLVDIKKCGNLTGCLFLKNRTYHMCNYVVKQEKLPPFLPSGEFMLELTFSFKNVDLYVLKAQGRIYRSIVRK